MTLVNAITLYKHDNYAEHFSRYIHILVDITTLLGSLPLLIRDFGDGRLKRNFALKLCSFEHELLQFYIICSNVIKMVKPVVCFA